MLGIQRDGYTLGDSGLWKIEVTLWYRKGNFKKRKKKEVLTS